MAAAVNVLITRSPYNGALRRRQGLSVEAQFSGSADRPGVDLPERMDVPVPDHLIVVEEPTPLWVPLKDPGVEDDPDPVLGLEGLNEKGGHGRNNGWRSG